MEIKLLDGLRLNENGELVNEDSDQVHLRQGDMDGACGPYCVVMALLATRRIKRANPGDKIDYSTTAGKLLKEIHKLDPLVLCGAEYTDLENILSADKSVILKKIEGNGKQIISKVKEAISKNHPVIMAVKSCKKDGIDHWILAIGASDSHIFLLDPGFELSKSNLWNSTLSTMPTKKRFGYRYAHSYEAFDVEVSIGIEIS